jgi:hypothetical protein
MASATHRLLEPLLRRLGAAATTAEPTRGELALMHAAYVAMGLIALAPFARDLFDVPLPPLSFDAYLSPFMAVAAAITLWIWWSVFYRATPPEQWLVSHQIWLLFSFGSLALIVALGVLFIVVSLLFAALFPPLAILLAYGPWLGSYVLALWLLQRALRGWFALRQHRYIGSYFD